MTEYVTHLRMKMIQPCVELYTCLAVIAFLRNCESKDLPALTPISATVILVPFCLHYCIGLDTFLCSIYDVVEGNAEEFVSPSSHNITFSPVDFSASATSSTLLEGGC